MATLTYTRNLRLRLSPTLTADAKYNLNRIDLLGASISIGTSEDTSYRSKGGLTIEPEAVKLGGSGVGGIVEIGTSGHQIEALNVFAADTRLNGAVSLRDSSTNYYGRIEYASSGTATADRTLNINLGNDNRSILLAGNINLGGAFTTTGTSSVQFITTGTTSLVLPVSGTLATLSDIVASTGDVSQYAASWNPGDGAVKTVTHGLASADVLVAIRDGSDTIIHTEIEILDTNSIKLTSSEVPSNTWRVTVHA